MKFKFNFRLKIMISITCLYMDIITLPNLAKELYTRTQFGVPKWSEYTFAIAAWGYLMLR